MKIQSTDSLQSWGESEGFDVSFGVQGAIAAAGLLVVPVLHVFGARLRNWGGPLSF